MKTLASLLLTASLASFAPVASLQAQHSHAYAGDNDHDGYLDFKDPLPTITLNYAPLALPGLDGFVYSGAFTYTAQHKSDYAGQGVTDVGGALSGTNIYLVLQSIAGPTGATFAFYEEGGDNQIFTLQVGDEGGTLGEGFVLTEAAYFEFSPSDPYGHIHDRLFSVDRAGTYTFTWALFNSEAGGTLSSTSNPDTALQTFTQTFAAVPEPSTVVLLGVVGAISAMAWRKRRKTVA